MVGTLAALCFGTAGFGTTGCGGGGGGSSSEGTVAVGVVTDVSGATYRLSDTSFEVTGGTAPLTLMTTDGSGLTSLRSPLLTPGQYSVQLLPGWVVERQDGGSFAPVAGATLTSTNPQTVSVVQGQIAAVGFTFMVAGVAVDFTPAAGEVDGSYD